jgi:hypothetical protein
MLCVCCGHRCACCCLGPLTQLCEVVCVLWPQVCVLLFGSYEDATVLPTQVLAFKQGLLRGCHAPPLAAGPASHAPAVGATQGSATGTSAVGAGRGPRPVGPKTPGMLSFKVSLCFKRALFELTNYLQVGCVSMGCF